MLSFTDVVTAICCRQCWNQGHSVAEISKTAGISKYKVRKHLKDTGVMVINGKLKAPGYDRTRA
jgi:hypothetical protein